MPAGNASWWRHAAVFGVLALLCAGGAARAEDAESLEEIETKYIFGFTVGSGIGLEGEKEFTIDTRGRFGKRDGRYNATETKYEFEFTPSQVVQINSVRSDRPMRHCRRHRSRQSQAGGVCRRLCRIPLLGDRATPLSVTLAFEPTWRWIDETSGEHVHNYEFETAVNADIELLRNRLDAGFNLLYEPEYTHTLKNETVRETTVGASAALSIRLVPNVLVGAEIWISATMTTSRCRPSRELPATAGPTLYVRFTPKMFMTAAWNTQVWGCEVGNPLPLNLAEFQRHRARLKFAILDLSTSGTPTNRCLQ